MAISEVSKNYFNSGIIESLNQRLSQATSQLATGKRAQIFGELGADSITSLSLVGRSQVIDGYINAISNVKLRTDSMNSAMTDIVDEANAIFGQMSAFTQGGGAPDIAVLKNSAANALVAIQQRLISRIDGKYVFAANAGDQAPIANSGLINTNISAEVASYQSGTAAATIIANIDAMTDAQLGLNTTLATAGDVTVRVDDGLDVNYTVKANEDGFKDIMSGLAMIANIEYDAAYEDDFWTLFNEAKSRIDAGAREVSLRNGQLGVVRNAMADQSKAHKDLQLVLEGDISNVQDVDPAQVSSLIQLLQFQMQATYTAMSKRYEVNFLNYL